MLEGFLIGFLLIFLGITVLVRTSWKELMAYTASGFVAFVITVVLVLLLAVVVAIGRLT